MAQITLENIDPATLRALTAWGKRHCVTFQIQRIAARIDVFSGKRITTKRRKHEPRSTIHRKTKR